MATEKQRRAARKNVKKAQAAWQSMSHAQHSRSQPQGRGRKKPGTGGGGEFFRIQVRPKGEFVTFRTQDVGGPGHIERVAGKRQSGSWDTQAWLVSKQDAHREGDRLVPDTADARNLMAKLGSEPRHVEGDVFEAKTAPTCRSATNPPRPSDGLAPRTSRRPRPPAPGIRDEVGRHATRRVGSNTICRSATAQTCRGVADSVQNPCAARPAARTETL